MPPTVDYLPFATGSGANVDSQVDFDGSGYQQFGFQAGLAQSKELNKVWRQSSMFAAAWANALSQLLNINVLDDGNLTNLINNLITMLRSAVAFPAATANGGPIILSGSGTAYVLPSTPVGLVLILKNGQVLIAGGSNDYTISGSPPVNVTLAIATSGSDVISALY